MVDKIMILLLKVYLDNFFYIKLDKENYKLIKINILINLKIYKHSFRNSSNSKLITILGIWSYNAQI